MHHAVMVRNKLNPELQLLYRQHCTQMGIQEENDVPTILHWLQNAHIKHLRKREDAAKLTQKTKKAANNKAAAPPIAAIKAKSVFTVNGQRVEVKEAEDHGAALAASAYGAAAAAKPCAACYDGHLLINCPVFRGKPAGLRRSPLVSSFALSASTPDTRWTAARPPSVTPATEITTPSSTAGTTAGGARGTGLGEAEGAYREEIEAQPQGAAPLRTAPQSQGLVDQQHQQQPAAAGRCRAKARGIQQVEPLPDLWRQNAADLLPNHRPLWQGWCSNFMRAQQHHQPRIQQSQVAPDHGSGPLPKKRFSLWPPRARAGRGRRANFSSLRTPRSRSASPCSAPTTRPMGARSASKSCSTTEHP